MSLKRPSSTDLGHRHSRRTRFLLREHPRFTSRSFLRGPPMLASTSNHFILHLTLTCSSLLMTYSLMSVILTSCRSLSRSPLSVTMEKGPVPSSFLSYHPEYKSPPTSLTHSQSPSRAPQTMPLSTCRGTEG